MEHEVPQGQKLLEEEDVTKVQTIDDYAKDDGPGKDLIVCGFYHEPLHT